MDNTKKFLININSKEYTILSDEDENRVRNIEKYINDNIDNIEKTNKRLNYERKLILALMNMGNDLEDLKGEFNKFKDDNSKAIKNYPSLEEKYDSLVKKNSSLLNKEIEYIANINRLKESNEEYIKKNDDLKYKLDKAEKSINQRKKELEGIQKNLEKQQDENINLAKQLQELKKEIERVNGNK